ncbi:beta-galactosidase [Sphingomonas sp. ASV193]|uniref:glycoside hydrolase 5 family protein n=1 Tax=Sphingomonas sp. ASV193 TaxID=3144405 RepID=UPI0032E89C88
MDSPTSNGLSRRHFVGAAAALTISGAAGSSAPVAAARPARAAFVRRAGERLMLGARRYRYVGTNMWYAAFLPSEGKPDGSDRLRRELDRLAALGVDNIRLLGSGELSPLTNSVRPAFRDRTAHYNQTLLRGLDLTLAEMGRRGMRAVLYLTNFWEWSGGMMTYRSWVNGGQYINNNDPAHPWPEFADVSSEFYAMPKAVAMYHAYVRSLVGRTNSVTGRRYADDPAIMAWQLANEPRPGGGTAVGERHMSAYRQWIDASARLIHRLDPNHLVSTGSEGTQGCLDSDACVIGAHRFASIDYLTAHIWPQNWSWADPKDLAGSWPTVERNTRAYFARQVALARQLGKPLVIEEFGFPRDGGSFDPSATTAWKDRFYALIHDLALADMRAGGPVAGTNFWAWGGEGRARHADHHFVNGDGSFMGDPPHEPQGWYSVLAGDSTEAEIRRASAAVRTLR